MIFAKKFAVIRIASVLLEVFFGLIQPGIFSAYLTQNNFGFLLVLYGCAIYFVFMDGGFSRILYAEIRQLFIEKKDFQHKVRNALQFYTTIGILIFAIFSFFSISLFYIYSNTLTLTVVVLISLGISINIVLSYIKSLFSAIDKYEQYEKIDIARKLLNIVAIFFIAIDKSLFITAIFTFCFSTSLLVYCYYLLDSKSFSSAFKFDFSSLKLFRQTFVASKNVVFFSLAEAFIYNAGFLFIPIIYTSYQVVQFGLWMKIFMGMAVFVRLPTDINIHHITKNYFSKFKAATLQSFNKTLVISCMIMLIGCICFMATKNLFFSIWVKGKYNLDGFLLIALFFATLGNSFQHLSGTFLMSTGKYFHFLRKTSISIAILHLLIYGLTYMIKPRFGILLIIIQVTYLAGSFIYFKKGLSEINSMKGI